MCLVGFASLQSPWAHTLKASLPCLPLPLYRPSPFLQPLQKNTYHLPFLLLPLHRILSPSHPLQKDNNPSPRTISLPPLPKVRCCRLKKFGRLPEGLPHHHPSLAPTLPNPHFPSKSTISLPPLSKGGGLTARHKLSLCCIFTCDTSAFFIHQTFCRQDGGIAIPPFAHHHILAI